MKVVGSKSLLVKSLEFDLRINNYELSPENFDFDIKKFFLNIKYSTLRRRT